MRMNEEFRNCLWCDKQFVALKTNIRRGGGKYCSRGCRNSGCARPSLRKGTGKKAERTCAHCNEVFLLPQHEANRGGGRFCSHRCSSLQPKAALAERFWKKVNESGPIPSHRPELGNCWTWTGSMSTARSGDGYGNIKVGSNALGTARAVRAHRVAWELEHGEIPDGMWTLHKCDNPKCVRHEHLFLGTNTDNMRDMAAKGRDGVSRYPDHYYSGRARRGERIAP